MSDDTSTRFDRVPATGGDDVTPDRDAILEWWEERFGIDPSTFEAHTFWERGRGNIWCVYGDHPDPFEAEGLGMVCLRTRGRHWKPTTNAAQRFGHAATSNIIHLDRSQADSYIAGGTQSIAWDGDWGYLLVATSVAGDPAILGVGQFIDGELRSVVPKGRRREMLDRSSESSP